jgi:hypothetical protein
MIDMLRILDGVPSHWRNRKEDFSVAAKFLNSVTFF